VKNIKSISKYLITGLSILSICLSILVSFAFITQQEEEESDLVAYEYTVTTIDFIGVYAHSEDNGGVFISPDQMPNNERIVEGDKIRVVFPSEEEYETIVAVNKINEN
jgi:hypothetical protein